MIVQILFVKKSNGPIFLAFPDKYFGTKMECLHLKLFKIQFLYNILNINRISIKNSFLPGSKYKPLLVESIIVCALREHALFLRRCFSVTARGDRSTWNSTEPMEHL